LKKIEKKKESDFVLKTKLESDSDKESKSDDQSDDSEKSTKSEKSEKSEKSDKSEKSESTITEIAEQSKKLEKLEISSDSGSDTDTTTTIPTTTATITTTTTTSTTNTTLTTDTTTTPKWEYKDENGVWQIFDRVATRIIEGSVSNGRKEVTLNHGEYAKIGGLQLDFTTITVNFRKTGAVSEAKRTPPLHNVVMKKEKKEYGNIEEKVTFDDAGKDKKNAYATLTNWKILKLTDLPKGKQLKPKIIFNKF